MFLIHFCSQNSERFPSNLFPFTVRGFLRSVCISIHVHVARATLENIWTSNLSCFGFVFHSPSLAKYTQLASVNSEEQFRSLLSSEEYEFRYDCGISKPSGRIPFSDKVKVVEAMSLHYCVLASLAELEQLRRGLAMQKFSTLMEAFPEIVHKAFNPQKGKYQAPSSRTSLFQDCPPLVATRGKWRRLF